jgi:hypothetical protein
MTQRQTISFEEQVRRRTWAYITPEVAGCAGLTMANLQQFIAHKFAPTAVQLKALARRMSVPT